MRITQKRQHEISHIDLGNQIDPPWPGDDNREPAELLWQDNPDFDQFFTPIAPDTDPLYAAQSLLAGKPTLREQAEAKELLYDWFMSINAKGEAIRDKDLEE